MSDQNPEVKEKIAVKQVNNITIGLIASWVFGVLFLLAGFGSIATSPVTGVIYFLTGLFILPPINSLISKKANFKLSSTLTFILIIVLGGIGSVFITKPPAQQALLTQNNNIIGKGDQTQPKNEAPAAKEEPIKVDIIPFKQSFQEGEFDLAIDETTWLDTIDSGNQFINNYTAKNKILRVRFTGENKGKKESSSNISRSKIVTKDGYEFSGISGFGISGQISESTLPKGFLGCLSCQIDPLSKAKEYIYFDFPQRPLNELTISLDGKVLALE